MKSGSPLFPPPSLLITSCLLCFGTPSGVAALDFKKDIQPILKKKCFKCHSGPRAKGKLRYDDVAKLSARIGTDKDAVILPGSPSKSLLIVKASLPRSDTDAMPPPRRGDGLSSKELATIKQWIAEGAKLESSSGEGKDSHAKHLGDRMKKFHSWTNTDGKTLKAAFVSSDGKTVTLRKEDGAEFAYPMSKLSQDSRKLAKELASGN